MAGGKKGRFQIRNFRGWSGVSSRCTSNQHDAHKGSTIATASAFFETAALECEWRYRVWGLGEGERKANFRVEISEAEGWGLGVEVGMGLNGALSHIQES